MVVCFCVACWFGWDSACQLCWWFYFGDLIVDESAGFVDLISLLVRVGWWICLFFVIVV